jgi:hypothetical protein
MQRRDLQALMLDRDLVGGEVHEHVDDAFVGEHRARHALSRRDQARVDAGDERALQAIRS